MTTKLTFDGTNFYNLDHVVQARLTAHGGYEVTLTTGDTTVWPEHVLDGSADADNATLEPCHGDWFVAAEVDGKLGLRPVVAWRSTGCDGALDALVLDEGVFTSRVRDALVVKRLADGLFASTDGEIMDLAALEVAYRSAKAESLIGAIGSVAGAQA